MKITGELLKAERLQQNLSLQDIANQLKISPKIVTAIEEGNIDALPAKTFVRGFVKSYAQILKLDANSVLRQFQEEMGSTTPLPKVPPPNPNQSSKNFSRGAGLSSTPKTTKSSFKATSEAASPALHGDSFKKIAIVITLAVVLIAVLTIGNRLSDKLSSNPVAVSAATTKIQSATDQISVSSATLKSTNTAVPTSAAENIGGVPIDSSITPDVTSASGSDSVEVSVKSNNTSISPIDLEEGFEKSTLKPVELMLEAKKEIEIQYSKADKVDFASLKLKANQVYVLRSKTGLYVKTNDGSALKVVLNGQDLGPAAGNNKPVKLSY